MWSNSTFNCQNTKSGHSYWVSFNEKSFGKGRYFKAYSGRMNGNGPLSGDRCVVRVFRLDTGTKNLCLYEVKKSDKAREQAKEFNNLLRPKHTRVKFSWLFWAAMDEVSIVKQLLYSGRRKLSVDDNVLIEHDLRTDEERPNKKKELTVFMDCHGKNKNCMARDLQAFAHFTYHQSNGQHVLCGLNGVQDEEGFYLKTPTIHSRSQEYGMCDRGECGILEVFANHVCNDLCKNMIKPNERLDNLPVDNGNYLPAGESSSALSFATNKVYPAQEKRMSHDVNNNDGSSVESDSAVCLRSCTSDHSVPTGQEIHSFQSVRRLPGCLEPSAPLEEDCNEDTFHPFAAPRNNAFVANWLLNEQARNSFINCTPTEPLQFPTRANSIDINVDSGKDSSRTTSNSDAAMSGSFTKKCLDNCNGSNRKISDHCDMNQMSSSSSVNAWSSLGSSVSNANGNPTCTSPLACQGYNTNFQFNSDLRQQPIPSFSLIDSHAVPCRYFPVSCPRYEAVDGLDIRNCAFHFFNGNQPLLQSPPSYNDSEMAASW